MQIIMCIESRSHIAVSGGSGTGRVTLLVIGQPPTLKFKSLPKPAKRAEIFWKSAADTRLTGVKRWRC